MTKKNNVEANNAVTHEQVIPLSSKSMMQELNQLFQNNNIMPSLALSSENKEYAKSKIPETISYQYRDFSTLKLCIDGKNNKTPMFPRKLHQILSEPNLGSIITWLPNGRAFKIKGPKIFAQKVLPAYFRTSNYSSFKRQLNQWGFRRITHNQYYHEMFLHGKPHLCYAMKRLSPANIRLRNKKEDNSILAQFHTFSSKYPISKQARFNADSKSKNIISTWPATTFKEIEKTDLKCGRSMNTKKPTRSNFTKAEITAILAMNQLSGIVCMQD